MTDIERVIIVCTGRLGADLWQHVWYDVSKWRADFTRDQFLAAMRGLIREKYLAQDPLCIRLAPKGEGVREVLETEMAARNDTSIVLSEAA